MNRWGNANEVITKLVDQFYENEVAGGTEPVDLTYCNFTIPERARILAQRRLLRTAYDLVRGQPDKRDIWDLLGGALGGRFPIKRWHLDTAARIIRNKHGVEA